MENNDKPFLEDGALYCFKLTNVNTQFTDVDMRNYKSATNPTVRATVEQTIPDEIRGLAHSVAYHSIFSVPAFVLLHFDSYRNLLFSCLAP